MLIADEKLGDEPGERAAYEEALRKFAADPMGYESSTELKLRVAEADWKPLDPDTKRSKLQALRAIAGQDGFESVFIEGASGVILGSATADVVWVP